MEVTGRAVGASLDFKTNHFLLTFEINENELVKSEYDRLKNYEKLKIKATRYTRKRSLDANAYFHVLAVSDKVLLIRQQSGQKYFVMDRIG